MHGPVWASMFLCFCFFDVNVNRWKSKVWWQSVHLKVCWLMCALCAAVLKTVLLISMPVCHHNHKCPQVLSCVPWLHKLIIFVWAPLFGLAILSLWYIQHWEILWKGHNVVFDNLKSKDYSFLIQTQELSLRIICLYKVRALFYMYLVYLMAGAASASVLSQNYSLNISAIVMLPW